MQTANGKLSRVEQIKQPAILPMFWEPGGRRSRHHENHAVAQLEQASQHWHHTLDIYTDPGVPEAAQMRASAVTAAQ